MHTDINQDLHATTEFRKGCDGMGDRKSGRLSNADTQEKLSTFAEFARDSGRAPSSYLTVGELNSRIKRVLDADTSIHGLWVLGEFSNVKQYPSGHIYAVLKDQMSEIRCVVWRSSSSGLPVMPRDGMKAFCFGDVTLSEQKGRYDFSITGMIEAGAGAFFLKMEMLKAKLRGEGLFERKRPIPVMPSIVALVTSDGGAVIHDMLKILSRRFPLVSVLFHPVKVQGPEAAGEIIKAISFLNMMETKPDVIVLARGGGSIEDLWTFNEEDVARAIYTSEIPVVTGIGHQTDFTIADFVADLRAATPSEAAEKAVPDRYELISMLEDRQRVLTNSMRAAVQFDEQALDLVVEKLTTAMMKYTYDKEQGLEHLDALVRSLNPSSILRRGYASITKEGIAVRSAEGLKTGDRLEITVCDGIVDADVRKVTRRNNHEGAG